MFHRFRTYLLLAGALIPCLLLLVLVRNSGLFGERSTTISTASPSPSPAVQGVMRTTESDQDAAFDVYKLYLLINAHRKEHSLSPLLIHPSLEKSASLKLSDMIEKKYYRHTDTEDAPTWHLFTEAEYHYQLAGENLSFGLQTPWQVFDGWSNSTAHNAQLLTTSYIHMGLAADCTTFKSYPDGGCIVVLHLGQD